MDIQYRIENMLRLRGMSISDLERASGIYHAAIYSTLKLKNRKMNPRLSFFKRLGKALGCTAGWLLQDREWMN